jgi:hypothetical protein
MIQLLWSTGFCLLALATATSTSLKQSNGPRTCCSNQADSLSAKQMKNLLRRLDSLKPPSLGNNVRLSGMISLEVRVDATGRVLCVRGVSGHPLIIGSAIEAVSRSEFASQNGSAGTCGILRLSYRATEHEITVRVEDK